MEYIVPILRDWINPQYDCQYLEKRAPYLSHTPKNWASENPVKHGKRLGIAQNCSKWAQNYTSLLSPSARARALNGRQEHQEDSSWLLPVGIRPASAGGAGCSGCGRVLQPPGRGSAPQNCPPAAYSTASQPLPPPQGLYCGHISPPPTGSRAGARRARLGARTARKVQRVLPPGRLKAAGRQYSPRNARTGCSGCCAGGRCVGRCCAGRQAVRPPAAAAPAPSLAGAVAPRAPNSAGTRHASSLSRGEQAVQRAKRARSRTFKAGSGHSKGIPLRIPSVPPS